VAPLSTWEERFPKLWAFGERVSVLVISGLLFYLFSALVVTIPAALVGVFAAVASFVQPVEGDTIPRFWNGFRRTFGRALALGLLDLVLGVILWADFRFFWSMPSTVGKVFAFVFASLGMVLALANVYAWPLLAWYPQPLGKLLKRSLLLAAAHPFSALAAVAGWIVLVVAVVLVPGALKGLLVLIAPGAFAVVTGVCAWLGMRRYAGEDDEFA
jgi:uncharacterized membrane protein YesL